MRDSISALLTLNLPFLLKSSDLVAVGFFLSVFKTISSAVCSSATWRGPVRREAAPGL